MLKHILISTDGSPVSNKAVTAGIALANALGAKVTAYCAPKRCSPFTLRGLYSTSS
jgi:nucleotide-binding universal stress UspA family protein